MIPARPFFAILFGCCIAINSCSQTNSSLNLPARESFVGSTPCDSLIRALLQIPPDTACIFIKWDLSLYKSKNDSGSFQLAVSYGDYQPNTMNFLGGGNKIDIPGKFTAGNGTNPNPRGKVYHLTGNKLHSELLLVQMDDNILHFADGNGKFIVGNAQFGYVLNRVQK